MIRVDSETDRVCVAKVHEAGHGHVFDLWEELSDEQQTTLIEQLGGIDFQLLKRLVQQHMHGASEPHEERVLKPALVIHAPSSEAEREDHELCRTLGEYALKNGEVGLVMAAATGGNGPESEPFGMLPVGPVTGKSLFQLQAEKIQAFNRRYRISLKWYIFCHPQQLDIISAFFKNHGYFGLHCSDIQFCAEELLPVVDRRGKLLLSGPCRIATSTVGQGGILHQLLKEERLAALERAGIRHLFYFQADNPLARIGDPVFLGHHIKSQSDVSSKAVRKIDPDDELPLFCRFNSSVGVVRSSELSDDERKSRLPDGNLMFSAAHIGIHIFSVDFLKRLSKEALQLPFRGVPKATPFVDKRGRIVRPTEPNSIRFQSFVFDVIKSARRTSILEVNRSEEFSPIKNTSGTDSPQTAQRDLSHLYTRWLRQACAGREQPSSVVLSAVEISPLYATDAEELKDKIELPLVPSGGEILLGGRSP